MGLRQLMSLLSVGLALALTAAGSDAGEKIRVAYPALAPALSPAWVTAEARIWQKHGLDIELILLGGGSRAIPALVSGSVQILFGSDTGVTMGILKGMELVRLGVTTNSLGSSLLTQPNIQSISSLKGKVLGISRGRDASYARLAKVLRDHGIDPAQDVKFLPIGGGESGRLSALKAKLIDGTMLFPPLDRVAKNEGMKVLTTFDVATPAGGINTKASFVRQHREVLVKFLKGYVEGIHFMVTHKDESLGIFARYLRNPDRVTMAYLYDEISKRVEKDLWPDPDSVRFHLDMAALEDPRAKRLSEKDNWDLTLLEEIKKSGFVATLYRN